MRLDMDCVRDALLCIEENTSVWKNCYFVDSELAKAAVILCEEVAIPDYQQELQKKYDNEKLIYHILYCIDANLARKTERKIEYSVGVADLTPDGHQFIANIRNNSNWQKTKELGGKVGAFSLSMVSKIAEGIATAYLKQQLGLF